MSDAYSPHKAVRHLDIIQAVRAGAPARPAHVQIVISDLCNHACDFCAYRDPDYTSSQLFYQIRPGKGGLRKDAVHTERDYNPRRMIPWPKVVEILDDCRDMGVSGVQFTGGGEPTVHPQWANAIDYAVANKLQVGLVTNGVVIGKSQTAIDVASQCAWVRVSIDAGTAATHSAVRHVPESHWDAAWNAVKGLSGRTVIGVGFVVTPGNWREIYEAARLAKEHGASNIRIGAQFSAKEEALFAGFHQEAAELARKAEALSDDLFKVVNRFSEKLSDLRDKSPDYDRCSIQSFTTYIGADLSLYRCCVYAYNDHGKYGSIDGRRFKDVWLEQSRADEMAGLCAKSCQRCQFHGINRFLNYATSSDEPLHSAFV